ncbi:MAG TPA: hypothetical protein VL096_08910, partial [Pirellulaceae bacterium]|nr:hypothetical protein [Pirellulaceae bacterium]
AVVATIGVGIGTYFARRRPAAVIPVEPTLEAARDLFTLRREMLEAKFVSLASQSGKPRGLTWVDCDFESRVAFARDRHTRQLRALVGVTIRFEATEGGGMEENPNVGNLRAATAVFRFENGQWLTDGRAIFNLNPAEAIKHFQHELETAD